jgi:ABC-type antimicrobial peptide transport system permease subunit
VRRFIARLTSAFGFRNAAELDAAMADEMRFHIDMEERLTRRGVDPQEARRQAAINFGGIGVVAVILATAGISALMSFTVARRTPEIGIRLALGANPRRIVAATFSRALAQVSAGVMLGIVPATAIVASLAPEVSAGGGGRVAAVVCTAAAVFMLGVTALACFAPARRALRIQPVDTLKST